MFFLYYLNKANQHNIIQAGSGAKGCLYYGFGICGSTVYCREGYKDAESALLHGADVKEMLEEPMKVLFTLQSL